MRESSTKTTSPKTTGRGNLPSHAQNRIISLAANARPSERQLKEFEPTQTHEAIAGALNDPECPHTLEGLAEQAGVDPKTLRKVLREPAALLWIVSQASTLAEARLGAVHARIYNMAMTSRSATWAKLFLERFDKDYKNQKILERGGAQQFNFLQEMGTDELLKWFGRKLQQLQGSATGGALLSHEGVPGVPGSSGDGVCILPDRDLSHRTPAGGGDEGRPGDRDLP